MVRVSAGGSCVGASLSGYVSVPWFECLNVCGVLVHPAGNQLVLNRGLCRHPVIGQQFAHRR